MNVESTSCRPNLYIALLHYPVYDKHRRVVTTCVTNLDLHDIARVATTYGLARFFVVQPIPSQGALVQRIVHHWREGFGASYNATRKEAFERMSLCSSLDQAVDRIREEWDGTPPTRVVTAAGRFEVSIDFLSLQNEIRQGAQPYLLLFGTGWGLTGDVVQEADYVLEPIRGVGSYNHLSVRSAVAVVIDRLVGNGRG